MLAAATLSVEDKAEFDQVIKVIQSHCIVQRNVISERAMFHQRKQEPGETVKAFVTALDRQVTQ